MPGQDPESRLRGEDTFFDFARLDKIEANQKEIVAP